MSIVAEGAATGGKLLRAICPATVFYGLISYDAVDDDPDRGTMEVVTRLKTDADNPASHLGAAVRASGDNDNKNAYYAYSIGSTNWRFRKTVNNSNTSFSDVDTGTSPSAGWAWLRLQATGTTVRFRTWADGDDEPSTWAASVTDSSLSIGWAALGLGAFEGSVYDFDLFGVGTGGDAATTAPAAEVTGPLLRTPSGYLRTGSGILRPA